MSEHHLSASMVEGRTHRMTEVVARLAPTASLDQAKAEVGAVYARMQREHRDAYDPASHYRVAVIPFRNVLGERARLTLLAAHGCGGVHAGHRRGQRRQSHAHAGVRREHELVVRAARSAPAWVGFGGCCSSRTSSSR